MHEYMGSILVQNWWGKPFERWMTSKIIMVLVHAENRRGAAGILVKQAEKMTDELRETSGQRSTSLRFVPGRLTPDPGEEWKSRAEPLELKDPYPDRKNPIRTRRLWCYYDVDMEWRLNPGKNSGKTNPLFVVMDMITREAAYTSGDGHLYTTQNPDSPYYQDPQFIKNMDDYNTYCVMVIKHFPDGSIDWDRSIPDLKNAPPTRKWVEDMEKTK